MFGFGKSRELAAENKRLADEVLTLKATNQELVSGTAGGLPLQTTSLGHHREQLAHFKGWQFVAIATIARRCAGQRLCVGRMRQSGAGGLMTKSAWDDDALVPLASHPLLDAVNNPNEILTRWGLIWLKVASLMLCGRAFWWLDSRSGKLQIWPLPPSWVEPDRNAGLHKRWLVRPPGHAEPFTVDADDMAFFSLPDPENPYLGSLSPLQSQAMAVTADESIAESQIATFRQGPRPGMILKAGRMKDAMTGGPGMRPVLTPEQRSQLINAIRLAYASVHRHGEAIIVDGLIDEVTPYTTNPVEMDFLASSKLQKDRIFECFGVNPIVAGQVENANRASSWVAEYHFCVNTINPILTLFGEALTQWVAPRFGAGLVVWYEKAIAQDDELDLKRWQIGLMQRVVTPNEYRRVMLGLPPINGGDELPPAAGRAAVDPAAVRQLAKRIDPYSLKRHSLNGNGNGNGRA